MPSTEIAVQFADVDAAQSSPWVLGTFRTRPGASAAPRARRGLTRFGGAAPAGVYSLDEAMLPGPSKTIVVEPLELPAQEPAPPAEPAPPSEPAREEEPEKVPAE
jgi:hypothetical protein